MPQAQAPRCLMPVVAAGLGALALVAVPRAAKADPCVDAIIHKEVDPYQGTAPAVIVGVTNACGVKSFYYFGSSEPAGGPAPQQPPAPIGLHTMIPIASLTKEFTSTLVMGYAAGAFSSPTSIHLTDTIYDYLPAAYQPGAYPVVLASEKSEITLQDLINMRSGLADAVPSLPPPDPSNLHEVADSVFAAFDNAQLPNGPPGGAQGVYSNFGYAVLGRAIENAVGPFYEDQIMSNIITPLGLGDANFYEGVDGHVRLSSQQIWRIPPGYNCPANQPCTTGWKASGLDGLPQDPVWLGPGKNPSGGLIMSVADLMAWVQAQIGIAPPGIGYLPQALGRAIVAEREDPHAWDTDPGRNPSPYWFSKTGTLVSGWETYITYNPTSRIGVFLVGNSYQFPAYQIGLAIASDLDSSTCFSQAFSPGMLGCPGLVAWGDDSLCPAGYSTCSAQQWIDYGVNQGLQAGHAYWTSDDLLLNGPADTCFVSTGSGYACPYGAPALVCPSSGPTGTSSSPDNEGNICGWSGCGYGIPESANDSFGGCLGGTDPMASTLCCRYESACAPGATRQNFAPGVDGCGGSVDWPDRDSLCAPGCAACSAAQWVTYNAGQVPNAHYWTSDDLEWGGTGSGTCEVMTSGGTPCPTNQPMRVCAPTNVDQYSNYCMWTGCGFEGDTPNEYFGGCNGQGTEQYAAQRAGTLCCCNQ